VAAAQAAEKQYLQVPTSVGITTPINAKVPTGKTIVYIYCGASACQTLSDGVAKAAAALGWNYKEISTDGTPASVKAGWDTAVRMHPAAVIGSGFDTSVYASELKQLQAMGVGVFNYATTDPGPNGGVTLRIGNPEQVGSQGRIMASWVVSDSQGKANTLYVDVPAYTILANTVGQFSAAYHQWCPGCALAKISLPITALGTSQAVQTVLSYLRAHPNVNYIAFSLDGADVGLPAALRAAGLSKVKFIGASGTIQNLGYIQAGQEGGTANQGYYEEMAHLVDAAARYVTHQSLAPDENYPLAYWLETKSNLQQSGGLGFKPVVPNLYAQLEKLWGR
jgi:ribose transport system substrate-binding protein